MEFVKFVGPAGVFFIMFALGLNLTTRNFIKIFKNFGNLVVGLICQIIILPIIGLILISLIDCPCSIDDARNINTKIEVLFDHSHQYLIRG